MKSRKKPSWLSRTDYPFASCYFETSSGKRIHYVDEGSGPIIVFVHGNPSWSYEFRHLIKHLRQDYRCIALDHVGFGLSDRGKDVTDFYPKQHAQNFTELIDHLGINQVTFFMSDWGGPIALEFISQNPKKVRGLIISNTWCWDVSNDFHFKSFSWLMSSWLGQWLIHKYNIFVNWVLPMAIGRKRMLSDEVMTSYRNAQPKGGRQACAALPGYVTGASDWLNSIWDHRDTFVDKPALLLWGMKDIAFRRKELEVWTRELSNHEAMTFEDCGHFLAEECPERIVELIVEFLQKK